jgi:SAM-dependent methyltransferase
MYPKYMNRGADFSLLAAAYEGVDDAGSFDDAETLEAYRESVLRETDIQADLIGRQLQPGGSLIEVGCGNGRLLIALVRRGAITGGLGLDLSKSRIDFARAWTADLGLEDHLSFAVADAALHDLGTDEHTTAVCITGALGYFDAYVPGSSKRLLKRLHSSLTRGGLLVLELYPHAHERRLLDMSDGHVRIWSELASEDPWRFYLSDLRLEGEDVLVHSKTFIHRTNGLIDEGRSERLTLYTPEMISALILECGFSDVHCLEGWSQEAYNGGKSMVVTASS